MDLSKKVLEDMRNMTLGVMPVRGGRKNMEERDASLWDVIYIVPAQSSIAPFDPRREGKGFYKRKRYGNRYSRGFELTFPFVITAMSYGAIGRSAKLAVHNACNKLAEDGIVIGVNTGEGGGLDFELDKANRKYVLIGQLASGRFGINERYLDSIDALEIKIGQGAKTGTGGHLLASKVTDDIANIREIRPGLDAISFSRHIDIVGPEDLTAKIMEIRNIRYWDDKSVIVKYGAANVAADVQIAVKAGTDIVAVDGAEGATGAAPVIFLEHVGKYTVPSIKEARRAIDSLVGYQYKSLMKKDTSVEYSSVNLLSSGGIYTVDRAVKALALGSDMIGGSTSIMIAMGCSPCGLCHEGKCKQGIATHDSEYEKKLDIDKASEGVYNYVISLRKGIKEVLMAAGYDQLTSVTTEKLSTTSLAMHEMTGIKMQGV